MPVASAVPLTNRHDPTLQPFLEACRQDDLASVQAQIIHRDHHDGSLTHGLLAAAEADHVETMRCLLEHGAVIDEPTVSRTRSPAGFQVLMGYGFGVNDALSWGMVPLMYVHTTNCCMIIGTNSPVRSITTKNDESLLQWFLSQGADPNLDPPDTKEKGFVAGLDPPLPPPCPTPAEPSKPQPNAPARPSSTCSSPTAPS